MGKCEKDNNCQKEFSFPYERDCLLIREGSPSEYLYVHLGDDEGADFIAYFASSLSQAPLVYSLKKINTPYTFVDQRDSTQDDYIIQFMIGHGWEKAKMIKTFLPGDWIHIFRVVREEILK